EAIKIGSRIAIMEGGRIIQCGTAADILNNPANDYVADFVAHMNPLAVCTAGDAMQESSRKERDEEDAPEVDISAPLKSVMEQQLESNLPVYVRENGKIVGRIDAKAVHATLLR
ncbi:MAG: choline ABC transporter ATP-binding protein, partial [Pseudomonadota bacterium]